MDREEAEYEARRARRLEEKRRLTAFLAEHSDSASSSDRSHRKRSKKHRKEKREKKEKKKDRKHDRKEKKSKKDRKHKKEREESKEDLEAYRRQAGLDWLSAGPSKRGMEEAREKEPEKKTDEKGEALDERIEDEVRRGFRDPISKRPYGLFDPKSMHLHETAALESDKPLVSHSQPSTHPLSQKELNKLVAKAMRAKLSGDLTLHQNLCAQIENAKKASTAVVGGGKVSPNVSSKMVEEGVSVLAPVDSSGRLLHRVAEHPDAIEKSSSGVDDRRRNRGMLRDKELEAHDAEMSIAEMAKREKEEGNMDEAFVENMLKNKNKMKLPLYSKRGTDEEFTDQDQAAYESMFRSKRARMSDSKAYELDRQRAIAAHRKAQVAESKSPFEFNSPTFKQHLVVSVGKSTYLMLPTTPIAPGHCRIVPLQSIAAMNMASREVLDEVAKYKSSLERMYQEDDSQSLVYLETVLYPTKVGWHTCIECVPVEESEAELVPMYFKKALLESGDEWAGSHHKIIDTSGKPISAAIPPHFAYFHVAWGGGGFPPGGYAHSIEDTSKYKSDFGIDVLRGVKGEAGFRFGQRRETMEVQKQRADSFRKAFAPFDWTQHEHG